MIFDDFSGVRAAGADSRNRLLFNDTGLYFTKTMLDVYALESRLFAILKLDVPVVCFRTNLPFSFANNLFATE